MKTLLVLGATPFQIPIVKKAKQLGHFVITMDNVPDNPAHLHADESANVSITDPEAVLAFARQRAVDGIITGGSEIGVAALGHVCDEMGLAGISHEQALKLTHKDRFRAFQKEQGLPHPDFLVFGGWDEFQPASVSLTGKFVLKPVDRSGSKGVFILDLVAGQDLEGHREDFEEALAQSLVGRVILEGFLTGREHGGDGFLRDGELVSFFITNKALTPAPYYVPTGHTIPSVLPVPTRDAVQAALENALHLAGFRNGPFNFDVMVDSGDNVTIIEIGPRFGGNGIPQIIAQGAGFDEIVANIIYALSGSVPDIRAKEHDAVSPTGSRILGCEKSGTLVNLAPIESVKRKFESGLIDLAYDFRIGDRVERFTQGNYRIGHIIATAPDLAGLDRLLDEIAEEIDVRVE